MAGFLRKKTKKIPSSRTTATFMQDQQQPTTDSNYGTVGTPLFARFAVTTTQNYNSQSSQDSRVSTRMVSGPMQLSSAAAVRREGSARASQGGGDSRQSEALNGRRDNPHRRQPSQASNHQRGNGANAEHPNRAQTQRQQTQQLGNPPPSAMQARARATSNASTMHTPVPPAMQQDSRAYTQPLPTSQPYPPSQSQPSVAGNRTNSSRGPPQNVYANRQPERSRTVSLQDKSHPAVASLPPNGTFPTSARQSQILSPAMANKNISDTALPETARRYSTASNSGRPPNAYRQPTNEAMNHNGFAQGANRVSGIGQSGPLPLSYSHYPTSRQPSGYHIPPSSAMSDHGPQQAFSPIHAVRPLPRQDQGYSQGQATFGPPGSTDRNGLVGQHRPPYDANGEAMGSANGMDDRMKKRLSASTSVASGAGTRNGPVQRQVSSVSSHAPSISRPRTLTKGKPKDNGKVAPGKRSPTLPAIQVPPERFVEYSIQEQPRPTIPTQQPQPYDGRRQSVQSQNGYRVNQPYQQPQPMSNGAGPHPSALHPSPSVRTNGSVGPVRGKPRIFAVMEDTPPASSTPSSSSSHHLPSPPPSQRQSGQFGAQSYPPQFPNQVAPQSPYAAPPADYVRPNTKFEPVSAPPPMGAPMNSQQSSGIGQYGKSGRYDLSRYPVPSQINPLTSTSTSQPHQSQQFQQSGGGGGPSQQQQRHSNAYPEVNGARQSFQSTSQVPNAGSASASQSRYSQQVQQQQQQKQKEQKKDRTRASIQPDTVLHWMQASSHSKEASNSNPNRRSSTSNTPEPPRPPSALATAPSTSTDASNGTLSTSGTVVANGITKKALNSHTTPNLDKINNTDRYHNGIPSGDARDNASSSQPPPGPATKARQHREERSSSSSSPGKEQQRSSVSSSVSSYTSAPLSTSAPAARHTQGPKISAAKRSKISGANNSSASVLGVGVGAGQTAAGGARASSSGSPSPSAGMSPKKLSKRRPNTGANAAAHLRNESGSSASDEARSLRSSSVLGHANGVGNGTVRDDGGAATSQLSLLDDDPFAKTEVVKVKSPALGQGLPPGNRVSRHSTSLMANAGDDDIGSVVNFAGVGAGGQGMRKVSDNSSVNTMVTAVERENSMEMAKRMSVSPPLPPLPPKDDEEEVPPPQEQGVYEEQLQEQQGRPPQRSAPPSPEAYQKARAERRGGKLEAAPPAELSTVPLREDRPPEPFPLILFLKRPMLLKQLLEYMSFWDWCTMLSISRKIRGMLVKEPGLRENVLERFLRTVGYQRWNFEDAEPLSISLQDLHDYMRCVSTPTHEYARVAGMYVHSLSIHPHHRDPTLGDTVRQLTAATRAYSRVVLRLRAQAEKEASVQAALQRTMRNPGRGYTSRASSRAPSPTRSTFSQSQNGHPPLPSKQNQQLGSVANSSTFKSPLFRLRRAPLLRVFVPSPEGDWLSDKSVLECEAECKRAGISHLLRLGDVVWDVAVGDEGNVGRMIWDGMYLIDLDYTFSVEGDLPKYLPTFAFPPSYFHRVIRTGPTTSNPVAYIDISPWGEEIAVNLQLIQDRVRTETPQGAHHNVVRWVHRSSFAIKPPSKSKRYSTSPAPGYAPSAYKNGANNTVQQNRIPIPDSNLCIDSGWYGTIIIETEGTTEALADLQDRCGPGVFPQRPRAQPMSQKQKENRKVFRILREKSRPGEIWIRTVGVKERLQ